jgi:hypothetical protein
VKVRNLGTLYRTRPKVFYKLQRTRTLHDWLAVCSHCPFILFRGKGVE